MNIEQYLTLLATMLAGFGFIYKEIKSMEKDLKADVKAQSLRSDQLYTMFIDLLKAEKKGE